MKKRLLSLFLSVGLCLSFSVTALPSASAANGADYIYVPDTYYGTQIYNKLTELVRLKLINLDVDALLDEDFFTHTGECSSMSQLRGQCNYFAGSFVRSCLLVLKDGSLANSSGVYPEYDEENGIWRPYDANLETWATTLDGEFPFVRETVVGGDVPAGEVAVEDVHANVWLGLTERSSEVETVTQDALASAVIELNDAGTECSLVKGYYNEILYYFICTPDYKYYCNSKGEMFVAPAEASATDLNRPHYNDDGDTMETPVIDRDNQTLNLPMADGTVVNLTIDNMTYDDGDKSYTVNAYTTINEGDEYYYTYYTYNIQYNITNTYITYIGSNEPYEREEYELYYELPDGRSSADLTVEEIAGMSFEFYDVVNYARSATDISVRGLYHFDGNLDDSSYFVGQHDGFVWSDGASITYMESPSAFGGNLYLDNTAHAFSIGLPSYLATGDFTIQFRYYQASEPDTQSNVENVLSLGDSGAFLKWDEQNLCDYAGTVLASLPIGTWNEIALMRNNGTVYVYLNGVCIGSYAATGPIKNSISFVFGSTSRAYSMLDELRILNFAYAEGGVNYTPTNVPHDSNLVLVLPDSDRPTADEYFDVESSYTNLFGDLHNYLDGGNADGLNPLSVSNYVNALPTNTYKLSYRNAGAYTYSLEQNSLFLQRVGSDSTASGSSSTGSYYWGFGFRTYGLLKQNTNYTLSIVHEDGTVDSLTFNTSLADNTYTSSSTVDKLYASKSFSWGIIAYRTVNIGSSRGNPIISICPNNGQTVDVAYLELVEGTETDIKLVTKTAVYKGEELEPNTAAIQTTIPVNGYTVGGVRPSMPAKGDLWFPVMENRITGVQIYAGTHWEEVNARWWTGSRWIPIYAFDINTLEDLFDIADGDDVVSLLPDTNSFFRWWQLQWLDFRQWLEKTLGSGGGGSAVPDDELLPPIQDDDGNGLSFVGLLGDLIVGIWDLGSGLYTVVFKPVFTNIGSSVSSITDVFSGEGAFDISVPEGGSIWD